MDIYQEYYMYKRKERKHYMYVMVCVRYFWKICAGKTLADHDTKLVLCPDPPVSVALGSSTRKSLAESLGFL